MNPTNNDIDSALQQLEMDELPATHPRRLARAAVAKFRSNAEREGLPLSNRHDDKGAPVLNVNEVLRRSQPNHAKK